MRTIISFCAAMLFIITPAQAQLYQLKPELEAPASQALQLMQCKAASLVLPAQLGQPFTMSVPFESGSLTFEMAPHSVVTADYKYMRELVDGTLVEIAPGVERTYRGTCVEFPEAVVAGSLIRSGFKGRVIWPNGAQSDLLIEPIFGIIAGAIIGDHAIYKTSDLMNPIAGVCGTVGVGAPVESGVSGGAGAPGSLISVRLACDTDSEFVLYVAGLPPNLDGTSVTVESKIMAMVNQVNAIYEMSTEDGGLRITHAVSFIMKRESSILYDIDTGASDAGDELLNRVRTEWNPGGSPPTQNRDIVHLFSGKPPLDTAGAMGAIGLAAPATVCTDPLNAAGWSIGDLGPDSILVAAHELGHNWGADHCDPDCPGNIMNTTIINGANIFTDGSIAAIQEHINTANSMGGCFNIVASSIFPTSSIDSVIAMSGDLLAISSPARIVNPPAAGSVSIYRKIDSSWSLETAISQADFNNVHGIPMPQTEGMGSGLAVWNNYLFIANNPDSFFDRALFIFQFNQTTNQWALLQSLEGPFLASGYRPGIHMAIDNGVAAFQTRLDDFPENPKGVIILRQLNQVGTWEIDEFINMNDGPGLDFDISDALGESLALSRDTVTVGNTAVVRRTLIIGDLQTATNPSDRVVRIIRSCLTAHLFGA